MEVKGNVKFIPTEKSRFAQVLRDRVNDYFTQNNISPYANRAMVMKTIVLLSAYILPFVGMLIFQPATWVSLLAWTLMGFAMAGIGMSVMHDANHGAYSDNKRINALVGSSLNLLGGSTENWKMQHNILHHTYTNIDKVDDDIQDRLILKFSPHSKTKSFHQFQWLYAFFMYGLLTLYWAVAKDFVQYRQFIRKGVNTAKKSKNRRWLLKLIGLKLFYFGYMIALPIFLGLPFWLVVSGFLMMHFVAGLVLTVTFQLAHSLEHTAHPLPDENGIIHCDWAVHQLQTTVNFAPDNRFLSWYMGGLNYQVEHHLFPRISHVHYPAIAPIVRKTAKEFGVPYMVNKTMGEAIASHVRYLKEMGKMPDLNEALG